MTESNLFARIPFQSSSYDEEHEFVMYEDNGNDCFMAFPQRKNLEHLELELTDAHARPLSEVFPSQTEDGMLSFRAVIRYDLFKGRQPEIQRIDRGPGPTQIDQTGFYVPHENFLK